MAVVECSEPTVEWYEVKRAGGLAAMVTRRVSEESGWKSIHPRSRVGLRTAALPLNLGAVTSGGHGGRHR